MKTRQGNKRKRTAVCPSASLPGILRKTRRRKSRDRICSLQSADRRRAWKGWILVEQIKSRGIRAQSTTKTGQQHEQENTACEDVCVSVETEQLRFYALADGQSGKSYCREGAQAVLHALAAYIRRTTVAALLRQSYEDEVQYALTRVIRSTIEELSESYQAEAAAFSSTVVALAVDP